MQKSCVCLGGSSCAGDTGGPPEGRRGPEEQPTLGSTSSVAAGCVPEEPLRPLPPGANLGSALKNSSHGARHSTPGGEELAMETAGADGTSGGWRGGCRGSSRCRWHAR